ncbi:argonaute-like protein [Ephemerocybe angulata]|uniref:Argonaute-like protein n=1 Tax=Ephemerocybe angulata TaxID=980116 RepID=A0A8H6MB84_9AGAR|nr:argonaute-like protein [Tulosesus angulatus]
MSYRGGGDRGGRGGRGGGPPGGGRGGRGGGGGGGPPRGGGRGGYGGDRGGRGGPPRGGFGGGGRPEQGGIFLQGPVAIDSRLQDSSQDDVIASFKSLSIASNDLPIRPGFGKEGRAIKMRANFFPVKVPKGPLFEYDIALPKRIKRRLFQLVEKTPDWTSKGLKGVVAHDHSTKLISSKKLPQPLTIEVPYYDEDEEQPKKGGKVYTLEIKFIQPLDTGNLVSHLSGQPNFRDYDILPVISALNLVLGAHPNRSDGPGVMVGRNRWFFKNTNEQPFSLGVGLEAWRGFYSSVRPAHNQLLVNVNVCTTAFYTPGNLADALINFRNASYGGRATSFVKGVRVQTLHLGYRKGVKAVSNKTARSHRFKVQEYNDQEMSVEEYFKRKYNTTLKYPDMPLVDVGGVKQNLLPAELCEILPNQAFKGKLLDDQTAQMIRVAAKPPNVNANSIVNQGIRELGFLGASVQMKAFGVEVGSEMAVVPARIIATPGVQYASGRAEIDDRASWNLRKVRFSRGAKLDNWAVLIIIDGNGAEFQGPQDPALKQVWSGFASMCKASGMQVGQAEPRIIAARLPRKDPMNDPTRQQAIAAIDSALKKSGTKPSICLVILSNGDKHVYSGIKKLCDTVLDLPTVCAQVMKIRKEQGQLQYFANIALKFNMKLGGVNHLLDKESMAWLKQKPTMIVGIDVTHPGPGSVRGTPSIAAVVASCDADYAQFPCSMEIQESKKEMVSNLDGMMQERLTVFLRKGKILPERILVYRDGVSEGQFKTVIEEELPLMKAAFRKYDKPGKIYNPALTIVICGKRHHTRFYPTEPSDGDRNGNPKPGTVVDRGVTSIYHFDFFLQAHGGLQGTTRPTHYFVVHDEMNFTADPLQKLTNAVSYMFARATKAVSLASPAYYADLACERGRCYLHKLLQGFRAEGTKASSDNPEEVYKEAQALWNGGVNGPGLKDSMFYL